VDALFRELERIDWVGQPPRSVLDSKLHPLINSQKSALGQKFDVEWVAVWVCQELMNFIAGYSIC
jgi:hypothetical protein